MKRALITGISGQDGAYLARFLLDKGYKVYGTSRRAQAKNLWRLDELKVIGHQNFELLAHDMSDAHACIQIVRYSRPDEVYNLAAQSFVKASFDHPLSTVNSNVIGNLNILEAIKTVNPDIKFYQASSSEMFGKVAETPQTETTPFYPRSPYGCSKLFSHWLTINYRESYDLFAVSGILFNHESPLRGEEFVTRKISMAIAKMLLGKEVHLELGNLNAKRDWGYAKEYVEGMWLMLQQSSPKDYVLATNETHSIRDFVKYCADRVYIDLHWKGSGMQEKAYDSNGNIKVSINPKFYRPCEVDILQGDYSKAKEELGWQPNVSVRQLAYKMVNEDIKRLEGCLKN